MRHTLRIGATTLLLLGGAASPAVGQATPQAPDTSQAPATSQGQAGDASQSGPLILTPEQRQALRKSLADESKQSVPGFQPSIGAPVPQDTKLESMPPDAKASMPQAEDDEVAKLDESNVIVIVHPFTRQVIGIISIEDDSTIGQGDGAAPPQQGDGAAPPQQGNGAPAPQQGGSAPPQ